MTLSSNSRGRDVSRPPPPQCLPSTWSPSEGSSTRFHYVPHLSPAWISFPELSSSSHTQPRWWDYLWSSSSRFHPPTCFKPFTHSLFSSFHPRRSSWHRIRLMVRFPYITHYCWELILPVSGAKQPLFRCTETDKLDRFYGITLSSGVGI